MTTTRSDDRWVRRIVRRLRTDRRPGEAVAATAGADAYGFADAAGPLLLETPA